MLELLNSCGNYHGALFYLYTFYDFFSLNMCENLWNKAVKPWGGSYEFMDQ